MSEAELHTLKARMLEGRRAKAARGELVAGLPRGYIRRPSGEVALDPDEQVRSTIPLVFDLFERRRSARGVLQYLADHDIQLLDRVRSGPNKGEVRWNRPSHATVGDMLRHPAYARRMSTAGAGWSVGASCPASRTAADGSSAPRSSGPCCTAGLNRPGFLGGILVCYAAISVSASAAS